MPARATLVALLAAALVGRGVQQTAPDAAPSRCMINFLDGCRFHPTFQGLVDDSEAAYEHMGVGSSEARCLLRAKEYFDWCRNDWHQQIIVTFAPTGAQHVFPADEVVEQAIERLSAAAAPAAPAAQSPAPPPPAAGGGGGGGGGWMAWAEQATALVVAAATAAAAWPMALLDAVGGAGALARGATSSAAAPWSVGVGVVTAVAVYAGARLWRAVQRGRAWLRDFVWMRRIDWSSPQRQRLLSNASGCACMCVCVW